MSESEMYSSVLNYLKLRGIPAKRNQCGALHIGSRWINLGEPGWPDFIACLPSSGRFLGIEWKQPGEEPSDVQRERIAEIRAAGGLVIVACSLDELDRELRKECGR